MAAPVISALPPTPSRLSDPANFFAESLTFLTAFPNFVSQVNALSAHLNAGNWSLNDWGGLEAVGSGAALVTITDYPFPAPTNPPSTGLAFIGEADAVFARLSGVIPQLNAVAAYIDSFIVGGAPPQSEPARPSVSSVTTAPLRTDQIATFNTRATSFLNSVRSFAFSLQALADYVTVFLSGNEDWLSIADAITSTDDWGTIG